MKRGRQVRRAAEEGERKREGIKGGRKRRQK